MIDRNKHIIFIHIPKTGGSSIESLLANDDAVGEHASADDVSLSSENIKPHFPLMRHATLGQYETLLQNEGIDPQTFRVFTLVRNPRDMLRSLFRFRRNNYSNRYPTLSTIQRIRYQFESSNFSLFLFMQICKHWLGRRPLRTFNTFTKSEQGLEVRVFKIEEISSHPESLMRFLGLASSTQVPHKNPSQSKLRPDSKLLNLASRVLYSDISRMYQ